MRLKGCHSMGRGALCAALALLTGPGLATEAKAAPVVSASPTAKPAPDTTAASVAKAAPETKATPNAKAAPDTRATATAKAAPDTKATATAKATPNAKATPATSDTSMTLRAGQSGTEFRSMTVEGEDRVHIDFGRPELNLDLDPEDVPGLSRGTAMDVLD